MKIRSGFVSNSSSSSFIISGDITPEKLKVKMDLSKFGTIVDDISKLNMKEFFPNPTNPVDWIERMAKEGLRNNKTIFLGSMESTLDQTLEILQNTKKFDGSSDSDCETTDFIIIGDRITKDDLIVEVDFFEHVYGKMLPGSVVFTGKMAASRNEMKEQAEELGFTVSNAVSKNTALLVYGENTKSGGPSSKYREAMNLGVPIVDEEIWNTITESLDGNGKVFYGDIDDMLIGILDYLDESLESNIIER